MRTNLWVRCNLKPKEAPAAVNDVAVAKQRRTLQKQRAQNLPLQHRQQLEEAWNHLSLASWNPYRWLTRS